MARFKLRSLPPAASPLQAADIVAGLPALLHENDPAVDRLSAGLQTFAESPLALPVASGRAALFLILETCKDLRPGRPEVIVPAYTCPVLVHAAQAAGLAIRAVDMDPQTLDYDRDALARQAGARTLAIVGVHPLGLPRPVRDVAALAAQVGAYFIDDAAPSLGARLPDADGKLRHVGTFGDAGLASFGPGKALNAGGGGVAFVNNPELAGPAAARAADWPRPHAGRQAMALARLAAYAAAFQPQGWWLVTRLGLNALGDDPRTWHFARAQLSAAQAVVALRLLGRLAERNRQRRAVARRLLDALPTTAGLFAPAVLPGSEPIFTRLPLLARNAGQRDNLLALLRAAGLGAGRLYRHTLAGSFRDLGDAALPGASEIARRLITLPTHGYVTEEDVRRMAMIVGREG